MTDSDDYQYMAHAIQLAKKGLFTTHPNPRVGCVIVNNGQIVGEGWHQKAGYAHAEMNALAQARGYAEGATAYVTLEPCCHYGKTPPCSQALIAAKIAKTVVAMEDPNPKVAGKGLAELNHAGIQTKLGILKHEAALLNPGFIKRMKYGLPYVRTKIAASVDGRTAMSSGESQWITHPEARNDVHKLRAQSSAIVTGINTVLTDDPRLNVRLPRYVEDAVRKDNPSLNLPVIMQPHRVVLDSRLQLSPQAQLFSLPGKVLVFTLSSNQNKINQLQSVGAQVIVTEPDNKRVNIKSVLSYLAEQACNEILFEAGSFLNGTLLNMDLIDELIVYLAPHLMGDQAKGLFHLPLIKRMSDRIQLHINDLRMIGKDIKITASVASGA